MDQIKIECPVCEWEPDGGPHWNCTCGYVWNTFDTGGICPNCNARWKDTQCPECNQWSPHIDWYNGLDEMIKQQIREALEKEVFVLR